MIDEKNPVREIEELSLLFEISRKLSETLDLRSVVKPVLEIMAERMDMRRGTLAIFNRKSGDIVIEEAYGLLPEERAKGIYRLGEGITGKVVESGEPAVIPRIADEPQFLDRTGSRDKLDKRDISFICVPVKIGSEVIGTLSVDRFYKENASFDGDIRLLSIIASTISQAVRLRQLAQEEMEKLKDENARLHEELKVTRGPKSIIGNSKTMRALYSLINKVCATNTTVLILGESGVGKEMVAHSIHYGSSRSDHPFIKFNCAALPESLIESELFGHEKGAFTGAASARKGRFECADGGTIFLDEIGEIPPSLQAKLLRVLQEREFERIGGSETIRVDVRIIAATNRDLLALMREGRFREDLYYRLNVFPLVVPPLRERKTDIMLLADYFAEKYAADLGKELVRISTPAIDLLMAYHWPGNVRELENCIERGVILSSDGVIHSYHLPPSLQLNNTSGPHDGESLDSRLEGIERELIVEELKRTNGNMARAARSLGITERIMGLRIAKYGIDPRRFRKRMSNNVT
ncbi:MAG TPA: sigma 54-interacting transcriptional regulator [Spirochaetota bacterium]